MEIVNPNEVYIISKTQRGPLGTASLLKIETVVFS